MSFVNVYQCVSTVSLLILCQKIYSPSPFPPLPATRAKCGCQKIIYPPSQAPPLRPILFLDFESLSKKKSPQLPATPIPPPQKKRGGSFFSELYSLQIQKKSLNPHPPPQIKKGQIRNLCKTNRYPTPSRNPLPQPPPHLPPPKTFYSDLNYLSIYQKKIT